MTMRTAYSLVAANVTGPSTMNVVKHAFEPTSDKIDTHPAQSADAQFAFDFVRMLLKLDLSLPDS